MRVHDLLGIRLAGTSELLVQLSIENLFENRREDDQAWVIFVIVCARALLRDKDPKSVEMLQAFSAAMKDLYSYTMYPETMPEDEQKRCRSVKHLEKLKMVERDLTALLERTKRRIA